MNTPNTIAEHIDCLARLTGAPASFIEQVRALFVMKGISLDEQAEPFLEALEEAFRREECIRASADRARQNLTKIQDSFRKVGKAYVEQLSQLKKIKSSLQKQSSQVRREAIQSRPKTTRVTIKGNHRSYVTKPVREDIPLVPGPKEIQ